MTRRRKHNIGVWFSTLTGLFLLLLFGFLPGFVQGADVPQTIATKSIVFTGLRFEPQSVKTGSIVFTGLRFEQKSVKTDSIMFTGLGKETTLGHSGSKALPSWKGQKKADVSKAGKVDARNVKPGDKTKTMSGEALTGFAPPSREAIKKNAGKRTTKTARAAPEKLGAKLVLKNDNVIKSIRLKANESFDLVFIVSNTGDTKSGSFQYAITCKVLRGGPKCPIFNMTRTVFGIAAQKTHEIKLNGIANSPGEYEVTVALKTGQLRNDGIKRVRLKVEAKNRTTTPIKGGSTEEDNDKPQIKQISPIKPNQKIEQRQTPLRLRGS
jgi:hypothetical protein